MHGKKPEHHKAWPEKRRGSRNWGRAVRLWTPVVASTVTTLIAIYEAWHGQAT